MTRLRLHESGRIAESASHQTPEAAMAAYRALLGRADLLGQPAAAVFKPPRGFDGTRANVSTFFSRFDAPIGAGRIHPDDPRLDPLLRRDEADHIAHTPPPPGTAPHDWESDPRSLRDCLHDWRQQHGWTWQELADELREPLATIQNRIKAGREPVNTRPLRRLMTLIDRIGSTAGSLR